MRILQLVCRACGHRFESGVPLARPELRVLERVRTLEVCPRCATASDYAAADYIDPDPADTAEFRGGGPARGPAVAPPRGNGDAAEGAP
jgi:hypothetical protein